MYLYTSHLLIMLKTLSVRSWMTLVSVSLSTSALVFRSFTLLHLKNPPGLNYLLVFGEDSLQ